MILALRDQLLSDFLTTWGLPLSPSIMTTIEAMEGGQFILSVMAKPLLDVIGPRPQLLSDQDS
jgi:hypothetical protein